MEKRFFLDRMPKGLVRFFAQMFDYSLFYVVLSLISVFFPLPIEGILLAILVPVLWLPLEALFLSLYKKTPGKALFGIRIEDHMGEKLPFGVAFKRAAFFGVRPGVIRQKAQSTLKKVLSITVLMAFLGVSVIGPDAVLFSGGIGGTRSIEGWVDYKPEDADYRVLFPESPEEISTTLPAEEKEDALKYEEAKSHGGKKVYYSVSYVKLPAKWKLAGATRLLQGALDLIVEHTPGIRLLDKSQTKHGSYRAMDFHMNQDGKEVKGRLVLVGTTLYRLTVVYPSGVAGSVQDKAFIDSFEING